MPGPSRSNRNQQAGTSGSQKRTAPSPTDSDDEDFQKTTLDTLRLIQQDIANSKKETLESQQLLAQGITKQVKHLEQFGAQQTVAAKSELNKTLLESMKLQTEELKKKQDARDEELNEIRRELEKMKETGHTCPFTIKFEVKSRAKGYYRMEMRSDDLVYLLKKKCRDTASRNGFILEDCFVATAGNHLKALKDSDTLSESGIQNGSTVYLF